MLVPIWMDRGLSGKCYPAPRDTQANSFGSRNSTDSVKVYRENDANQVG